MAFSNTANSAIFSKAATSVKASTGGGVIKKAIATDAPGTEEKDASLEGLAGENINPERTTSEAGQSSTTKSGTAVASANKLSTLASSLPGLSAGSNASNQTASGTVTNPGNAAGSNAANQTTNGTVTNPGNAAGSHLEDLSGNGVVTIPGIGAGSNASNQIPSGTVTNPGNAAGSNAGNQTGNGTITPPSTGAPAPGTDAPGTITPPATQPSAPTTPSPGTITPPSSQPSAPTSPSPGTIGSSPYASNGLGLGGLGAFGSMGLGSFGGGMPGLGGFGGMGAQNRNNANQGLGGGGGAQNGLNGTPQTQSPEKPELKAKDKDDKKTDEKKTEATTEEDLVANDKAGTFPKFIEGLTDPQNQEANQKNFNGNFDQLLDNPKLQEKIKTFIEKDLKDIKPDAKSYPKDLIKNYEAINKELERYSASEVEGESRQITKLKLEDLFKPLNITPPPPDAPTNETPASEDKEATEETEKPLDPNANTTPTASLDNDFDIESLV